MKKILISSFVLLLAFAITTPTTAHEGWSQTHSPIVEPGENIYIELLFGNHSNNHASYRIEGNWNEDNTVVNVHTPDEETVDVTSTLFYMGETDEADEETMRVNNYHIASFSAIDPGIYTISTESDSVFSNGGTESQTLRSAKSFTAVSDIPTFHEAIDMEGYEKEVTPDRAEFIPKFNPAALAPDEEIEVQLVREGSPVADEEVSVIRRSNSESEVLTTDENGIVSFTSGAADYYLIRAKEEIQEDGNEYDIVNYEATMTFTVQNGEDHARHVDAVTEEDETLLANESEEVVESMAESDDSDSSGIWSNGFLYLSIVLGAGLIGSTMLHLRK